MTTGYDKYLAEYCEFADKPEYQYAEYDLDAVVHKHVCDIPFPEGVSVMGWEWWVDVAKNKLIVKFGVTKKQKEVCNGEG